MNNAYAAGQKSESSSLECIAGYGWQTRNEGETIATFGKPRLVKQLDGKIRLVGGSAENRTAAKKWVPHVPA